MTKIWNDNKAAKVVKAKFGGVIEKVYGDDGNLHIHAKNQSAADAIQENFGHMQITDGVQEGNVVIWVGDKMVYDNL